jgi:hypothetical protein
MNHPQDDEYAIYEYEWTYHQQYEVGDNTSQRL